MGFIKAFQGALSGTFADQWHDFYIPRRGVNTTAAIFQAVPKSQNNGIGENYKGNENIITNGSKIVVPEGTALITLQDGQITGFIAEPGGFIYTSTDANSQSIFAGNGIINSTLKSTWEKVKFGGQASSEQTAFYVNLKEIPGNKFGTQSPIYWDDAFFGTQVGAITRGDYSIKIEDPLLFVKNFVPMMYLQPGAPVFDFADISNKAVEKLFNEVVGCLAAALSNYTNDPDKGNRITRIQGDTQGFAESLSKAVEESYHWLSERGLSITKATILSIEYDEDTKELMKDVKRTDALQGARGNAFMQQSVARGIQAAGENGGGTGMAFMGMGMNASTGMMQGLQQEATPNSYQVFNQQQVQTQSLDEVEKEQSTKSNEQDIMTVLSERKKLLDAGLITQEDYDALKAKLLGL